MSCLELSLQKQGSDKSSAEERSRRVGVGVEEKISL